MLGNNGGNFGFNMMNQHPNYNYQANQNSYQYPNTMQQTNNMQNPLFGQQQNQFGFINSNQNSMQPMNQNNFFNNGFHNSNTNMNPNQGNNQMGMGQNPVIDQNVDPNSSPYTDLKDLPNVVEGKNTAEVLEQIKLLFEVKDNWKSNFDALDNLRILNKFFPGEINDIFANFWKYITASLESQKTHILKNVLIFIKEVFSVTAKEVRLHDDVISGLIPYILKYSTSEKKLIKAEGEVILEEFTTNCCYDSSIIALCKACFDKNPSVTEVAFLTLGKMICNIGENLPKLSFDSLQALIITLAKTLDSAKKGSMKKWATMVCGNICQMFGLENYYQLIQNTMAEQPMEQAQLLIKAIEDKKDKRESGFHNFVQEQKMRVRQSQNFGNMPGFGNQKMNPQSVLGQQNHGFMGNGFGQMGNGNMSGFNNNNGMNYNFPQNY